jgi:endonuclease YncB( thermonuclease family)
MQTPRQIKNNMGCAHSSTQSTTSAAVAQAALQAWCAAARATHSPPHTVQAFVNAMPTSYHTMQHRACNTTWPALVTRVIDGDTLVVVVPSVEVCDAVRDPAAVVRANAFHRTAVRLRGYDAPEIRKGVASAAACEAVPLDEAVACHASSPGTSALEHQAGKVAQRRLTDLLHGDVSHGIFVTLHMSGVPRERSCPYGRIVADVAVDAGGIPSIAHAMLRSGCVREVCAAQGSRKQGPWNADTLRCIAQGR